MKLYTIHRDPKNDRHWRETHTIADKRVKHIARAVHRINDGSIAFAMNEAGQCWAACRVAGETIEGSCASSAMIEQDATMRPYMIDHSTGNTIDKIIEKWEVRP